MNYVTETVQLGILDSLTSNIYMMTLLFIGLLMASAFANGKRGLYYQKADKSGKMSTHGLNTIHHLDEKKHLDYDVINMTIAYYNMMAAIIAGASIVACHLMGFNDTICFAVGIVVLLAGTYLLVVQVAYKKIAEKYARAK